ncbi:MAG: hypothetical protein WBQ85_06405 [Candidatus Sulfotelmatobacter sp.]
MAVERIDRSDGSNVEQTVPVSEAPGVQGQTSPGGGDGKPPRRPPPEEASAEQPVEDQDPPEHRIDSLA